MRHKMYKNLVQAKLWYNKSVATVAQLVEQLIRNEQVAGSTPVGGSIFLWRKFNNDRKSS